METEKLYKNKEWLEEKYEKDKFSTLRIGRLCNVHNETIGNWLKKYDIPIRSYSESTHLAKANHCNLSQEAIEWINGELLGDGCLTTRSPYSATFQYTSKYLEYAEYVSDTLKSFGIKQVGNINKSLDKKYNSYCYYYCSNSYIELLPIRRKWYPEGKKRIPKDLDLTSLSCRQWVIGDGCLLHPKNGRPYIKLSTQGFIISDVEWLINQLIKLGFKATRIPSRNIINISTHSTKNFLSYIGKCPVSCYQYKWAY